MLRIGRSIKKRPIIKPIIIPYDSDNDSDESSLDLEEKEKFDIFNIDSETTDKQLRDWGNSYIKGFKGVVARSHINELYPPEYPMERGSSCILNLDYGDYVNGGTHWVAMRVSSETPRILYIDSFGEPPCRDVTNRALKDSLGVYYPDISYQTKEQTNCGQRSLAVLHYLQHEAEKNNETEAFNLLGHT
jgi:hypothetical protein